MGKKTSRRHLLRAISRPGLRHLLKGVVLIGAMLLAIETLLLSRTRSNAMKDYLVWEGDAAVNSTANRFGLYPPEILASKWAQEAPVVDLVHLGLLHEACLRFNDSIIPWTFGRDGKDVAAPDRAVISESDPDVLDKIRSCPDVDIYLPDHIRNHGYCEDSSAYAKCTCAYLPCGQSLES
jgi:hypothetical protein